MKRRDFIRTLAAAGSAAALSGAAKEGSGQVPSARQRDAKGAHVEHFSSEACVRSGMALGGIGAGYMELRKNGRFYDWSIFNNYPKETGPIFSLPSGELEDRMAANLFFEVRYQIEGEQPRIKLLQINDSLYEGAEMGIAYSLPWMQAVNSITYSARFPVATLVFTDEEMPFEIKLEAWSSFIPHDVKNSALPLVFFDFEVTSKDDRVLEVMLLMTARNSVGYDAPGRYYTTAIDRSDDGLTITMGASGMDEKVSTWGQISLASLSAESSFYAGWAHRHPYYEQVLRSSKLPNVDDTNGMSSPGSTIPSWMPKTGGRNRIDASDGRLHVHDEDLFCTIARTFQFGAHGHTQSHSFLYGWNFPNLYNIDTPPSKGDRIEGHFYTNFFANAAEVTRYGAIQRKDLKQKTLEFLENFFESDADVEILEQVNSQLNTFFTSGRLVRDGSFGVLEGLASTHSWGPIATIDVMYYGTAPIIALFPELQKATMRCHARVQLPSGEINHGLQKDFRVGEDNTADVSHRIDLPAQFVTMALRDYFWTNDEAYLNELWNPVKSAIDYVLRERSNGDGAMPVTRGIETSYDNFPMFGYASSLLSQWMCAMIAARDVALAKGEKVLSARYSALLEKTQKRMETSLWNGSFYSLYADPATSTSHNGAEHGCLTDQLVGLWATHPFNTEPLLPRDCVHTALMAILKRNYDAGFGLRNCSFSADGRLGDVDRDIWNDQANTMWSGVELAFAALLIYEGMCSEGLSVAKTVNARYRKNGLYWNHQEYGGHYFRPMSAWSLINALLGFSIRRGTLAFDPKLPTADIKLFFATPTGTAHYKRRADKVSIEVLTGRVIFSELDVKHTVRSVTLGKSPIEFKLVQQGDWTRLIFNQEQTLTSEQEIILL
jgi:non-lysosomal glucosylceramidase